MRHFAPGWGMTLACAALLPVLVALGFWQLERAGLADRHQSRYLERLGQPAAAPSADLSASLEDGAFLRVRLEGEYLGEDYLVDNRVREGRPGYWVLSRFQGADGRVYLVNRGWQPAPPSREALPEVAAPAGRQRLVGTLWPATGLPPLLAADPWPGDWPKRVQRLDVARMADEDAAAVPVEIRLEPGQPGVLEPAPLVMNFRPERHRGYAVQWFSLAVVLSIGYLVFGFRGPRA